MSKAEEALAFQLKAVKIEAQREYRFHPVRRWRFDFAMPDIKMAIEVEGILWGKQGGRHQTGKGFEADLEKYDEALRLGWTVYRCSPSMVKSGRALETIELLIKLVS